MGTLYLLTSFYPAEVLKFVDADFLSKLSIIMVLEFIMTHSGVFFLVFIGAMRKIEGSKLKIDLFKKVSKKQKALIIFSLYAFYLIFAAGFAGWYGILDYTALSISRCYYIFFGRDFNVAAEIGKSFVKALLYLLSAISLLLRNFHLVHMMKA